MCTLLLALAGTALSVGGALMEGKQQQQMADMQAKAYEQQAQADAQSAAFEASQERHKQDLLQSQARAAAGASGVAIAGSPTEVLAANAKQNQLDLSAIRYGSQLRQNNLNTQVSISRFSGQQAKSASIIKAGSSLVSGLSNLYDPNKAVKFGGSVFGGSSRAAWAGA
jgi:transglutaminase/protease-like cytokinesis protein 3